MKIESINNRAAILISVKILGWLLPSLGLLYAIRCLSFEINLLDWHPDWNVTVFLSILGACVATGVIVIVSRFTKDRVSQIMSLILSLLLVLFIFETFPAEATSEGWLGRSSPSPLWFRASMSASLIFPTLIWLIGPFRFWRNEKLRRQEK
jgi:hypothetical protein